MVLQLTFHDVDGVLQALVDVDVAVKNELNPGDEVQRENFLVFESEDFLCSNQKISCVRIKRFRVFESEDFL